jgi:DNA primase small subunit
LDASARKEIVDYVTCLGFEMLAYNQYRKGAKLQGEVKKFNYGWNKYVNEELINFLLKANEGDFIKIGLRKNIAKKIAQQKEVFLKNWASLGVWSGVRGVGAEALRKIAEHVAKMRSSKIDTVVSTDIHRLIRLPETLHGKTGFKKIGFPAQKIEDFNPLESAVVFKKGTATLSVWSAPKFKLNGEIFGPYKNQKVELPISAAVLLVCKNKAEVVEYNV